MNILLKIIIYFIQSDFPDNAYLIKVLHKYNMHIILNLLLIYNKLFYYLHKLCKNITI
jgi:hypothetical protein